MIDREKVIKGLRCIKGDLILCVDCAYSDGNGHGTYSCKAFCANDAIDLLNEQEAVEPEVEVLNEIDRLYRCPRCHKHFFYEKQKYCDECGQAVKWE